MNETSLALSRVCNYASPAKSPKIHLNQQTSQTQAARFRAQVIQIQCSDYTRVTERELKSLYTHVKSCTDMFSAADRDERLMQGYCGIIIVH